MILVKHHNEGNLEPFFYFALEDYVLNTLLKGDETYFFTWRVKGIISGKNQVIENEINFDYVKENNIRFFRRPTGGGSVYADENNTMFTIVTKRTKENFSFKNYLGKIIEAFKKLNVNLEFSGRNDILLDGKKISGNSFLQNRNGMLMHGTMMYDLDIETMVRSLNPPDEKLISKGIESVRSRVANLKEHLNGMTQDELILFLEKELCDEVYEISEAEIKIINEKAKDYMTDKFIYQDQPSYTQSLKKRFTWGMFEIRFDLNHGQVLNAKIIGDFFELKDEIQNIENSLKEANYDYQTLSNIIKNFNFDEIILGSTSEDILDLLKSAFLNV